MHGPGKGKEPGIQCKMCKDYQEAELMENNQTKHESITCVSLGRSLIEHIVKHVEFKKISNRGR